MLALLRDLDPRFPHKVPLMFLPHVCCITFSRNTASLAASARISAQETTPGQAASTAFFALSMIKNPCRETFGGPSFSALLLPFEFSSTEASHPFKKV
ncbi:unnamed protein product [Trifolium pratense]|uniref:Uncharacterized protein n=1 Tax=Trifolium pratense TaxID=57577 RepID=A0ACB0IVB3_TRIPR|nr:unnamed protein product [Trifolium pratense]